ncbi:hypothetical protein, partial [uncultured Bacteroides sp.]|uniref:hypothetical protein n=1 Tax=uncultured Bacteroides sp. TaxID=162156 RepID=UPI002729DAA7
PQSKIMTLSKILCKWKQDLAVSLFLYGGVYNAWMEELGSVLVLFRGLNSFVKYWHNSKCV